MGQLTGRYIEDHLVNVHTEESWARGVVEMVLSDAMKQLAETSKDEVVIDAKFRITAVDPPSTAAAETLTARRGACIMVCVVVSPTGRQVCYHKQAPM